MKFEIRSSKCEEKKAGRHGGTKARTNQTSDLSVHSLFDIRYSTFRAFTLVEMLVVIAIIALLLAALLPAFASVRNQAKITDTAARFRALDTGIRTFQAESAIGGALPPSSSDNPANRQIIMDPRLTSPTPIRVAGAHLLVHAMIGADGLGTPGFRDVSRGNTGRGTWFDDTHKGTTAATEGIYAIGDDGKEKFPRYGGAGYVDENLKSKAETIQDLANEGKILNLTDLPSDVAKNERMFMDPWDHPILYYRANPSLIRMTAGNDKPGIFWQEDNSILTGSVDGLQNDVGVDFGQGVENNGLHAIKSALSPDPSGQVDAVAQFLADTRYERTFAKYIVDPAVKARLTPVNKDSYLLISAGPDSRYGTSDDVVNWTKKTD